MWDGHWDWLRGGPKEERGEVPPAWLTPVSIGGSQMVVPGLALQHHPESMPQTQTSGTHSQRFPFMVGGRAFALLGPLCLQPHPDLPPVIPLPLPHTADPLLLRASAPCPDPDPLHLALGPRASAPFPRTCPFLPPTKLACSASNAQLVFIPAPQSGTTLGIDPQRLNYL